ncbi:MAG: hypothetical protein QF903_06740 [Planctomycetota bacterium]|nr:hypothetical protein [Planctomycetota bacterium]MDP6989159.1 hypothetical protein [Planctomycetota bacterium]
MTACVGNGATGATPPPRVRTDAGDPERVVEEARFSRSAARGREVGEDGRWRSLVCVFMKNPG